MNTLLKETEKYRQELSNKYKHMTTEQIYQDQIESVKELEQKLGIQFDLLSVEEIRALGNPSC